MDTLVALLLRCLHVRIYHVTFMYADLQKGDWVGPGLSTHVPLSATNLLGQVHTGPLGLSRHSHSHFFLSHGLVTEAERDKTSSKTSHNQDNLMTFRLQRNVEEEENF